MSGIKSVRLALMACFIVGGVVMLALDAAPAAAQAQPTETTQTTQPTETTQTTQPTQPTQTPGEPPPDRVMGIVVLGLGAVALAILFAYLEGWRRAYVKLSTEALKQTGSFPEPINVLAAVPVPGPPGRAAGGAPAPQLAIKGPSTVFVGRASEPFTALQDGNEVDADWAVREPEAQIAPARGRSARITATKPGRFTVVAQAAGTEVTAVVTAITPPPSSGGFPLIASGYAGFTIAIVAICVAGALTAVGWLPGAALATLLGTVVSYFFVQQTSSATRGDQRSGDVTRPPP